MKIKKAKIRKVVILTFILSTFLSANSYAINKIDERKVTDSKLLSDICSHVDIMKDRKQGYPALNFTESNIEVGDNYININSPDKLLSIGDGGICRIIEINTNDTVKKVLTIDYGRTVVLFSEMENEEILVKNGEVVKLGTEVAKASKAKMELVVEGKNQNPYTLLFNELYPRGGMKIPLFSQLDKRWKNDAYGDTNIYIAGCGPSSLSMIYSYFENKIITPSQVVSDIGGKNSKYLISGQGSSWNLMTEDPKRYGIKSEAINAEQVVEALKNNRPVIALMGNGYFTNAGHFIVLRGIDKNGNILVNNPADFKGDYKKAFNINFLKQQSKQFWAFSK